MPLRKTSSGWMWGSKHFKTKAAALAARKAAYASGYKGENMVTFSIRGNQAVKDDEGNQTLSEFVSCLLHSAVITHIMHWQTESYAAHKALGEYYEEIPDLVDAAVEAYQGKTKVILRDFPVEDIAEYQKMTPLAYLEYLSNDMTENRQLFGEDSEIQNLVDAIADLIDSTMYKLRKFK